MSNISKPFAFPHEKLRLFITFSALESFRLCYLRLCFWISEQAELLELESLIFVLFSLAVVVGMIAAPLFLDKTRFCESPERLKFVVRVSVFVTAVAAIASYFAQGYLALVLQFVATVFTSGAMAICLRCLAGGVLNPRCIGRFIGFSFAVMAISGAILFFLPFVEIPTGMILIVTCAFLVVAAVCFDAGSLGTVDIAEDLVTNLGREVYSTQIRRLALLVIGLYSIAGGFLDNIYFFDDAFELIPNFMFWILLYAFVCDIVAGFVFERVNAAVAVICAFLLICVGQSMSFFSQNVLLVYPYTIFSNAGNNIMEIYLISLPIAYCVHERKKPGILPGLGYIMLYGSFFLTSILFEFIPDSVYRQILGIVLLASVMAIVVTFYIMQKIKDSQLKHLEIEFNEKLASAVRDKPSNFPVENFIQNYRFTKRETEVLLFLLDGKSTSAIAEQMAVTEKTIQNYINSLLSKTGMKSRAEMIAKFVQTRY